MPSTSCCGGSHPSGPWEEQRQWISLLVAREALVSHRVAMTASCTVAPALLVVRTPCTDLSVHCSILLYSGRHATVSPFRHPRSGHDALAARRALHAVPRRSRRRRHQGRGATSG